jgi:8-oxo-dGTP diphosphatase
VRRVQVVAAVVRRGDEILISKRRDDAARGGQWEFPGGKVEPGEAEPDALRREIDEELGCSVLVGPLLVRTAHRYPDLEVQLAFFACELAPGPAPRPLGVAQLAWAKVGTLASYDFCEADRPVLATLEAALPWSKGRVHP